MFQGPFEPLPKPSSTLSRRIEGLQVYEGHQCLICKNHFRKSIKHVEKHQCRVKSNISAADFGKCLVQLRIFNGQMAYVGVEPIDEENETEILTNDTQFVNVSHILSQMKPKLDLFEETEVIPFFLTTTNFHNVRELKHYI